jgi:cobalamin biosynthesis protein CobD/CbiB
VSLFFNFHGSFLGPIFFFLFLGLYIQALAF